MPQAARFPAPTGDSAGDSAGNSAEDSAGNSAGNSAGDSAVLRPVLGVPYNAQVARTPADLSSIRSGNTGVASNASTAARGKRAKFVLRCYIDEVDAAARGVVVWSVAAKVFMKLKETDPVFGAKYACEASLHTSSVGTERPYFPVGDVVFKGATQVDGSSGDGAMMSIAEADSEHEHKRPAPPPARLRQLLYHLQCADSQKRGGGAGRDRYDLAVVIAVDARGSVVGLRRVLFRYRGGEEAIATRDVAPASHRTQRRQAESPSAAQVPPLMLTPAVFDAVPMPRMTMYAAITCASATKRQGEYVWNRLASMARDDWAVYAKLRAKFRKEYAQKMRELMEVANPV